MKSNEERWRALGTIMKSNEEHQGRWWRGDDEQWWALGAPMKSALTVTSGSTLTNPNFFSMKRYKYLPGQNDEYRMSLRRNDVPYRLEVKRLRRVINVIYRKFPSRWRDMKENFDLGAGIRPLGTVFRKMTTIPGSYIRKTLHRSSYNVPNRILGHLIRI